MYYSKTLLNPIDSFALVMRHLYPCVWSYRAYSCEQMKGLFRILVFGLQHKEDDRLGYCGIAWHILANGIY